MSSFTDFFQILCEEHFRTISQIDMLNPYCLAYLRDTDCGKIPQSVEEFINILNIDIATLRLFKLQSISEQGVLVNSGRFYEQFKNLYFTDQFECLTEHKDKLPSELISNNSAPTIPVILELFTDCIGAISFETNGNASKNGGGVLVFDARLNHVIRAILAGCTQAIFMHSPNTGSIAPMASLFFYVDEVVTELKINPNKAWILNSSVSALSKTNGKRIPLYVSFSQELDFLTDMLADLIVHFFVAHEYSHLCCWHNSLSAPTGMAPKFSENTPNHHSLEYEADRIAMSHLRREAKRKNLPPSIYLPYFLVFFMIFGASEELRDNKLNISIMDRTHPDSFGRISNLLLHSPSLEIEIDDLETPMHNDDRIKLLNSLYCIYEVLFNNFTAFE